MLRGARNIVGGHKLLLAWVYSGWWTPLPKNTTCSAWQESPSKSTSWYKIVLIWFDIYIYYIYILYILYIYIYVIFIFTCKDISWKKYIDEIHWNILIDICTVNTYVWRNACSFNICTCLFTRWLPRAWGFKHAHFCMYTCTYNVHAHILDGQTSRQTSRQTDRQTDNQSVCQSDKHVLCRILNMYTSTYILCLLLLTLEGTVQAYPTNTCTRMRKQVRYRRIVHRIMCTLRVVVNLLGLWCFVGRHGLTKARPESAQRDSLSRAKTIKKGIARFFAR